MATKRDKVAVPAAPKDQHSPGPYAAVGPFMLVSKANLGAHLETIATFNGDRKEANRQRVLTLLRLLDGVSTEILEHPDLRLYWVIDDVVVGETEAILRQEAEKASAEAARLKAEVTALRVIAEALVAWQDGIDHPLLDTETFGVRQLHCLVTEARAALGNQKPADAKGEPGQREERHDG